MDIKNIQFKKPGFWGKFGEFVTGNQKYMKGDFANIGLFEEDRPLDNVMQKITTTLGVILVIFALLFTYGFVSAATNNRIARFDSAVASNVINNVTGKPHAVLPSEITLLNGKTRVMDADMKALEVDKITKVHGGINLHG